MESMNVLWVEIEATLCVRVCTSEGDRERKVVSEREGEGGREREREMEGQEGKR